VRAGEWDTLNEDELYPAENRNVVEMITHESFNDKTLFNDVALLFTDEPFPMDIPTIATICMPPPDHVYAGQLCTVSGWGKDQFGKEGKYPNILKKIELPAITNANCQAQLRTSRLGSKFILNPSFLCAGEPGKDACRGDGGSPLVSNPGQQK
jgi:plasma kallikrein